ncbi:MAG: Asp-tRNA(Asn)/Glu-tRNA(Gln) amidotransferase subunit GatC [Gemmatimonadaceae bacterium]
MAFSLDDVRHVASLARLALTEDRARALADELNTILTQMEALARVDTASVADDADDLPGMSLRPDAPPPDALTRPVAAFAPSMGDGFFLVPRLATHETEEGT